MELHPEKCCTLFITWHYYSSKSYITAETHIYKTEYSEIARNAQGDLLDHNLFEISLSTVSCCYRIVAFLVIILPSLVPLN